MRDPHGGVGLSFQYEPHYVRPVWPPSGPADPQMMLHLEIRAENLDAALAHALDCGAALAEDRPQQDVRVCLDPAGRLFCLWLG